MKKLLLIGMLGAASVLSANAEQKQAVMLFAPGGEVTTYYLDQQPTITFEGQNMVVTTSGGEKATLPLAGIERWEIGMAEYTGIADATAAAPAVGIYMRRAIVANPAGENITVYSLAGAIVAQSRSQSAEFNLAPGIYVIAVGAHNFKIAIR